MLRLFRLVLLPVVGVSSVLGCAGGGGDAGAAGANTNGGAGAGGTLTAIGGTSGGAGTGGLVNGGAAGTEAGAMSGGGAGGGAAGASGAGGATAGLCLAGDCRGFVGELDGYLFEYPCAAGNGCSGEMCVNQQLTITQEFKVMGDATKVYEVALHVRGVTESKNYTGGVRRSMAAIDPGPAGGDLWYEGGTAPLSSYSSYELHVTPAVVGAPNDYFLNARDGTDEHDGTTWALNYEAKVKVMGGGTVTFKTFDSNCSAIRNCGPQGGSCMPRSFDLSDAVPAPTATQPIKNANQVSVQWVHLDVTGVTAL